MERDDHLIWLTKVALWPLAVLTVFFGPTLFLLPGRTDVTWSWEIQPEMSAIVVGAGYILGALTIPGLLLRNQWHALNTALWVTWTFSTAMLLATLLHLDRFFIGTTRFYVWFIIYLLLPFALPVAWWFNRHYSALRTPDDLVFETPIRYGGLIFGLVLTSLGLFMFLNPPGAAAIWPWQLTPLMSRVIGGWVMFFGTGGIVLYIEPRYSAYRALLSSVVVYDILLLIGSLLYLEQFDFTRTSVWVWFVFLITGILSISALLAIYERRFRQRRQGTAPVTTT
jgi:hypothetical protein